MNDTTKLNITHNNDKEIFNNKTYLPVDALLYPKI